jgi:hypothetical protein
VAGALAAGMLHGDGRTVNLAFTADGGRPSIGQTVWLASSQDDSNTGRGKATATQPTTAMPVYPLFTQNVVPVGICINNARYTIDGSCQVRLSLPTGACDGFGPCDETFNLRRVTDLIAGAHTFFHDGNAPESSWQNNESIWIAFTVDQVARAAHEGLINNVGSGSGWTIFVDSAISIVNQRIALKVLGTARPGLNVVCATRTGGTFRGSLNGEAVQTMADPGTAPGPGAVMIFDYTRGGVCSMVMMSRALSDAELQAFSGWNSLLTNSVTATPTNYFGPPPSLIADPGCRWHLDLTSWVGGAPCSIPGPAGFGFQWTIDTAEPASTPFSYVWNRSPRGLYLDGPLPSYDSKHLSRDRQLQRIAFTCQTVFDVSLLVAAYSLDDTDNGDEGAVAVLINGEPLANIGAAEDGVTRYSPLWNPGNIGADPLGTLARLTAPYHVEILVGDKLNRVDTFDSGGSLASLVYPTTAAFDTPDTSKRLVIVADGVTYGGHSADFGSAAAGYAVVTRVRADYPGRVSAFACQVTQGATHIRDWGNGSVEPYAYYVVANAHEGNPCTVVYLIAIGFADWFNTRCTVAEFSFDAGLFVDRLHAQDPAASFAFAKPVHTHLYPQLNFNGETLQQFADAVAALGSGRPWLTILDLSGPNPITFSGSPLAISPSIGAGQIALQENIKYADVVGYAADAVDLMPLQNADDLARFFDRAFPGLVATAVTSQKDPPGSPERAEPVTGEK